MPTVTELKAEARKAEQRGDLVEAIDIYQHILHHLESWPDALAEELDLFTRVGDLRVELHQPARAFGAYRQAAEHFARLGAADDIKTLCVRMINVVPASADAYAQFAKRLLAHGHLKGALDVLRDYAGKAGLRDVTHTLNALAGRSSGETRALLSELLDSVERDYTGHTAAAARVSAELATAKPAPASTPSATAPAPEVKKTAQPKRSPEPPSRSSVAPKERTAVTTPPAPFPARTGKPAHPSQPAPKQGRPAASVSGRPSGSRAVNWRPIGIGGAVVAGIALLVVAAVQIGGGETPPAPEAIAAMIDTSPGAVDEGTGSRTPPGDTARTAATQLTQSAPVTPPPTGSARAQPEPIAPPVAEDTTTPTLPDALSTEIDSSAMITEPLVVGDLPVQSVAPAEFRGQTGFRVVHLLTSGTEFVVESYPVDSISARRYPVGSVIVNNILPDTTVSIVRFDERYLVFASGTVPEDSARVLIALLRVRPETP